MLAIPQCPKRAFCPGSDIRAFFREFHDRASPSVFQFPNRWPDFDTKRCSPDESGASDEPCSPALGNPERPCRDANDHGRRQTIFPGG